MNDPMRPTMKGSEVTYQEHPEVEAVLLYAEGRADTGTSARVEAHLRSGCASCREAARFMDEVIGTFRVDAALNVPVEVRQSALELFRTRTRQPSLLQRLVATLTFDSRMQPAMAGVRGAAVGSFQLVFQTPALSVDLACEAVSDQWRVMGQALAIDGADGTWQVRASGAGEIKEVAADELGIFQLRDLPPGTYTFTLSRGSEEVILPGISLTAC